MLKAFIKWLDQQEKAGRYTDNLALFIGDFCDENQLPDEAYNWLCEQLIP